jgi:hypothetical protein
MHYFCDDCGEQVDPCVSPSAEFPGAGNTHSFSALAARDKLAWSDAARRVYEAASAVFQTENSQAETRRSFEVHDADLCNCTAGPDGLQPEVLSFHVNLSGANPRYVERAHIVEVH